MVGNGAPKIPLPQLDFAKFTIAPCSLLSAAQLQKLGLAAEGKPVESALGVACAFHDSSGPSRENLTVGLATKNGGLTGLYGKKDQFGLFQAGQAVAGYPSVIVMDADDRSRGNCTLSVGVADERTVDIDVQLNPVDAPPDLTKPCERAYPAGEQVVATLKGGE